MNQHITNPPAFPTENEHQSGNQLWHYEGMSLRDYFAAKAMHASMTSDPANEVDAESHARWAYEVADAMLKARSKP